MFVKTGDIPGSEAGGQINMPKVVMTCGKLCSGKTTYAKKLQKESKAVILSVDEIMLALFGQDAGEKHDDMCVRRIPRN